LGLTHFRNKLLLPEKKPERIGSAHHLSPTKQAIQVKDEWDFSSRDHRSEKAIQINRTPNSPPHVRDPREESTKKSKFVNLQSPSSVFNTFENSTEEINRELEDTLNKEIDNQNNHVDEWDFVNDENDGKILGGLDSKNETTKKFRSQSNQADDDEKMIESGGLKLNIKRIADAQIGSKSELLEKSEREGPLKIPKNGATTPRSAKNLDPFNQNSQPINDQIVLDIPFMPQNSRIGSSNSTITQNQEFSPMNQNRPNINEITINLVNPPLQSQKSLMLPPALMKEIAAKRRHTAYPPSQLQQDLINFQKSMVEDSLENFLSDKTKFQEKVKKLEKNDPNFKNVNHRSVFKFDSNEEEITRKNIHLHKVSERNKENIEDFLEFKILPKAGNLTIGLKKIIKIARAFLTEPIILILEENALDFDELDNSFFFDILKVKKKI